MCKEIDYVSRCVARASAGVFGVASWPPDPIYGPRAADNYGWTCDNFNEYLRIRQELRIKCKEAWNQNWEDNINNIIHTSKDSKAFWNKINLSKGKNLIHTNYL